MECSPPNRLHNFVITCKDCHENIPAPVETLPDSWTPARSAGQSGATSLPRFSGAGFHTVMIRPSGGPTVFDPYRNIPRINRATIVAPKRLLSRDPRGMVYLGACLIAGIRLAREKQVNVRVIPDSGHR